MRYKIFRTVSIIPQPFGILTFSTFRFLPVKLFTLQDPAQATQHTQKPAELHRHPPVPTLSHGQCDAGSRSSGSLPACLPAPTASQSRLPRAEPRTRRADNEGNERPPCTYAPGWKPQRCRSCFQSRNGNNLEGGSDWTTQWHSPLLSQFHIL